MYKIILLCIIFCILLLILYLINNNNNISQNVVNNLPENVKYPSILVLNRDGKYCNKISYFTEKILLIYNLNTNYYSCFLNNKNNQCLKDEFDNLNIYNDNFSNITLFGINYRLYLGVLFKNKYNIISLNTKRTYKTDFKNISIFKINDKIYNIDSISPFIVYEISDKTFKITKEFINININTNYKDFKIISNPILINNIYWLLIYNNNYLILITFEINNKFTKIINEYKLNYKTNIYYNNLIYNELTNEFLISVINKNNKISIFKIKKNYIIKLNESIK